MDPLSITAAVVGLLSAAGQVGSVLSKIKSSVSDAPESIQQILSQVKELEACFAAVHKFVLGVTPASRRRLSMIEVDQLVATLTESVLTFFELEVMVTPFGTCSEASIRNRLKWAWREDDISRIILRLDRHKSSLSLMLNIVQCESDLEAEQSQQSLLILVQQLVESNLEISRRLQTLETTFETESESILTACFRNGNPVETRELEETSRDNVLEVSQRTTSIVYGSSSTGLQSMDFNPAFEVDLNDSRVYKRTQPYECDVSFTSSAVGSHSWSVFSGLSLSQISSMSVIALPVYSHELANKSRCGFVHEKLPDWKLTPILAMVDENIQIKDNVGQVAAREDKWAYKLVVLGDNNVGKTALTAQLITKQFIESYDPTVEESHTKHAVIDGWSSTIEIRDTGHQEEYIVWTALADQRIRGGEGFLLVYSVAKRASFERISRFYTQIDRVKDRSDPPLIMLVGNNIDKIKEREVTRGEAEMLALKLGCSYIETSAKANVNVEKAFYDLVRRLRQQREKWGLGMYSPAPRTHQPPQKKNKGVPRIWQRVRARPA